MKFSFETATAASNNSNKCTVIDQKLRLLTLGLFIYLCSRVVGRRM